MNYTKKFNKAKRELKKEYTEYGCVCGIEFFEGCNNKVLVLFTDNVNGIQFARTYKNKAIAKREATKFMNRCGNNYNNI